MDLKALLPILQKAFDEVGYPAIAKECDVIQNAEVKALVLLMLPFVKQMIDAEFAKLSA